MNKKRNVLKRNSGFIVGCLLAAGASYFTADAVMTRDLASVLMKQEEETQLPGETTAAETLAPEESKSRTYETDPFTVTASGNVIKGVEAEVPQQTQTEPASDHAEESENSGENEESNGSQEADGEDLSGDGYSGDGSYDDGSYDEGNYAGDGSSDGDGAYAGDAGSYGDSGYADDGSYYGDGYYEQPIEIQDPGNGDYSYGDGGGTSSGGESASTPSDVIIQGISSRYIGEEELYNYDLGQLRLIRNEIFALHGRIFEAQDLRDYFSQKSWYVPTYPPEEFDANMFYYLNDYEEANLNVILNYEAALGGY